jgi:Xaa-Pro aminopeptidase
MASPTERLNGPISTAELERRWALVRSAMEAAGLDVLVMQNNNDHMGGYVKYFTDLPATNGYPVSVVFPRNDLMTFVRQGPFGGEDLFPAGDNAVYRGIGRVLFTPSYSSCANTRTYDAELIASALRPYATGRIGLVGTYGMSHAHASYLQQEFPQANFTEASDLVDAIRAIKSPEEIALIRATAVLQDNAMQAAMDAIRPGMRDSDVAAEAIYNSQRNGSEQGIYLCASAPICRPLHLGQRHFQNRMLREGDQFILLVENNGIGGQYCEIGRTCVLGKVPPRLAEEFAFTLEARRHVLDLIKPGALASEVFASYQDFLERNGRPKERRIFAHSQGYDMVERPLIRHDETMTFAAWMNLAVHPSWVRDGVMSWICDNYLIGGDGRLDRLHAFPEAIIER